jgi:hypothetical protein
MYALTSAGSLLVVAAACGGAEEKPSSAPLPASWVKQDQGGSERPESEVIGDPAPRNDGASVGARGSQRAERQRWAEAQALLTDLWNREAGPERAQAACRNRPQLERAALAWLEARARLASKPATQERIREEGEALERSLESLARMCAADRDKYGAASVEGSLQSIGYELERLRELPVDR